MQAMNWDDLRIFLAAARSQTLTDAARQLGVNQTTVSRRVQGLEQALGVKLLERGDEGLALTASGRELINAALEVEQTLASLERRVSGRDAQLQGTLRVTSTEVTAFFHADLFAAFTLEYPGIALEVSVGDALHNLTRHEADIALRWTNQPPPHLVGRPMVNARFALYGARGLFDGPAAPRRLRDLPWLAWDKRNEARLTDKWMRERELMSRVVCRLDSALPLFAAIRAGTGVGFIPCAYGDADPDLLRLRPPEPGFDMQVWLLTHPDLRDNARVRAFRRHALSYFESRARLFEGGDDAQALYLEA